MTSEEQREYKDEKNRKQRERRKRTSSSATDVSIKPVVGVTDVLVGKTIGRRSVSNTDSQPFSDNNNSSIPIDVVCDTATDQSDVLIPTELITSTDTNTNLLMDVVCRSDNDTQSVAEIPATTSIIIDNLATTSSVTEMTAPSMISLN